MLYEFNGYRPVVDPSSFVHPQAAVTGNVIIGKNVYVGPGAAIRGDWGRIILEDGCNVQENCTIHLFPGATVQLAAGAHMGHGSIVHGATIGANCLIGMNSVIMDNAVIGPDCIIGALSFVKEGAVIPARSVVAGNPAKVIREVSDEMLQWKTQGTAIYQALPGEMRKNWRACEAGKPGEQRAESEENIPGPYRPWKATSGDQGHVVEEPALAYGRRKLSIEEYLEMEEKSDVKHEYHKGDIFAMSGPKVDHVRITMNLSILLGSKLRGSGCEVFATDLRVYVESEELFTYPDLSIVCGEPVTRDNDNWNVMNPSVIVEVLSRTTMQYDRGTKFELYKGLPSLKEYILVDSRSVLVEQFCADGQGRWLMRAYDKLTDSIVVETVGMSLLLDDMYENVRFPDLSI